MKKKVQGFFAVASQATVEKEGIFDKGGASCSLINNFSSSNNGGVSCC